MSDRENRDRIEALESRLKRVEEDAAILRDVIKGRLDVPAADRGTAVLVTWLGRRSEPVAVCLAIAAIVLPFWAALWLSGTRLMAVGFVFGAIGFFLVLGSYHSVRTLNHVRTAMKGWAS